MCWLNHSFNLLTIYDSRFTNQTFDIYVRLSLYFQIVEDNFRRITGVESGNAAFEVFSVGNAVDKLAVDVKRNFGTTRAHFKLIGIGAGADHSGLAQGTMVVCLPPLCLTISYWGSAPV